MGIRVVAMKDVLYGPNSRVDKEGKCQTDLKLYKAGEEFEIEKPEHFSDYDKVENIKGITFRGSMRKVGAPVPEPLVVPIKEKGGKKELI